MNSDEVLARLGLQTKASPADFLVPALGVFGIGMLVGAGVALTLAPKSGREFRGDLGRTASRLRERVRFSRRSVEVEDMTRDELYAQAKELEIEGRSDMTKTELAEAVRAAS